MQSFWDYLRLRSRDSVLAGIQEAIDIVEGDGSEPRDRDAARRYLERHAPDSAPLPNGAPAAVGGPPATDRDVAASEGMVESPAPGSTLAPVERGENPALDGWIATRMQQDSRPLDPFEQRLQQTNPALVPPQSPAGPKKRGRPRKNP